jgi:hypothetical protein
MMEIEFTCCDDDGEEISHSLPAMYVVCDRCEGFGTHLHEAIAEHAYSLEEFNESFDEEEREEYFKRGGRYDVVCTECKGLRVVSVVNRDACTTPELVEILKKFDEIEEQRAEFAAIQASERRYGA